MIRFQTIGGWWSQVLLAQRVEIMTENGPIQGVISSTPPHLLEEAQRKKPMEIKNMMIDIGADDKEDARKLELNQGSRSYRFVRLHQWRTRRKSWQKHGIIAMAADLRLNCWKSCKGKHCQISLYSGATVQEEVGLRGAQTAANIIKPDLYFALDASAANDVAGNKEEFGQLGKGALLRIL